MYQCDSNIDMEKYYVGQWPVFHGQLILPLKYHCDRLKLFLYIKNGTGREYSCLEEHLLYLYWILVHVYFQTEECKD